MAIMVLILIFSCPSVMDGCTAWEYHERTSPAGLLCHSRVPVPVCLPGCEAGITFTSNVSTEGLIYATFALHCCLALLCCPFSLIFLKLCALAVQKGSTESHKFRVKHPIFLSLPHLARWLWLRGSKTHGAGGVWMVRESGVEKKRLSSTPSLSSSPSSFLLHHKACQRFWCPAWPWSKQPPLCWVVATWFSSSFVIKLNSCSHNLSTTASWLILKTSFSIIAIVSFPQLKYDCSQPSSSTGQQQQHDGGSQCLSKVLPTTISAGCFRHISS